MLVGTFEVKSGALFVSDPCYTKDTWCAKKLENVKNGTWIGHIEISDEGSWGKRVALLSAHHSETESSSYGNLYQSFEVGVDSGQMGIFDYDAHPNETGEFDGSGSLYDRICNMTCNNKNSAGVVEHGVVSSSGFGDGGYEGRAFTDSTGKIVRVEVEFIGEDSHDCEENFDEFGCCDTCGNKVFETEDEIDCMDYEPE
jgi:hypothetical protein